MFTRHVQNADLYLVVTLYTKRQAPVPVSLPPIHLSINCTMRHVFCKTTFAPRLPTELWINTPC